MALDITKTITAVTYNGNNFPIQQQSTLITKTITANGTYNASSDSADGYSQVTVTIPVYDGTVV